MGLRAFSSLDKSERALLLSADGVDSNIVDTRLVLERDSVSGVSRDRLRGVKLLFMFCERMGEERGLWLTGESVDRLKAGVWTAFAGQG